MRCLALLIGLAVACKSKPSSPPIVVAKHDAATSIDAAAHESLAAIAARLHAEKKVPALAAAVWIDGKLVENVAVGLRKANDPAHPVTTEDLWHLGSNTKAMTALLVGIHVERGTLRWDDTIAKLFEGEAIDAGYANVTLAQLVRHNSGATQQPPAQLWAQLWSDGQAPDARRKFVRAILAAKPAHPATTFAYSNTNYMIVGAALERATKQPWEQLMRDELFAPLGMSTCGFGAPIGEQPWGHDANGPIEPGPAADNPPGLGPAGTVHCSLADYGKFLALFTGHGPAIVKPETLAQLQVPNADRYAGGWLVAGKLLVHNGSNTFWMLSAAVSPSAERALVIATNKADPTLEDSLLSTFLTYAPP